MYSIHLRGTINPGPLAPSIPAVWGIRGLCHVMNAALSDVFLSFFEDFLSDYQGGALGRGVSTSRQLAGGKSGAGLAVIYFVAVNTRFYGTSTA